MQRIKSLFMGLALILAGIVLGGCDKIDEPYMNKPGETGPIEEVVRKFLLEEFTGHRCPNCPEAAEIAELLKSFYGDRLVIISVHAGWFSNPMSSPYNYDFRTSEGNALNSYFGVEQYPQGLVNRTEFEGSKLLSHSAWGSAITVFEEMEPDFAIIMDIAQQGASASYNLNVDVTSLNTMDGEYYLVAVIVEDGIVKPQKTEVSDDYPTGDIWEYEHNHVLREGVTDIWGDKLNDAALQANQTISRSYTFTLDQGWVSGNCSVVAYIMNSQLEVLQVEELKLP